LYGITNFTIVKSCTKDSAVGREPTHVIAIY